VKDVKGDRLFGTCCVEGDFEEEREEERLM